MQKKHQAYLLLLATVLVWGATFALVKSAFNNANPLLFNAIRFTLATIALAILNRSYLRHITPTHLIAGATAGLFLALGYELQSLGLNLTTPIKSAFITGLVVIFVPLFCLIPVIRPAATPRPGLPSLLAALIGFTGLLLITTPAGTTFTHLFLSIGLGDLLTLFCALAFAAHLLTLTRASKSTPTPLLATLQIAFAALFMLLSIPLQPIYFHLTPILALTLLICALLGTAAAFTIQSFAQSILPPTHTVLILTLEPVFAWLTALLFLHEHLDRRSLLGAALILTAIAAVELLPTAHSTEIPA